MTSDTPGDPAHRRSISRRTLVIAGAATAVAAATTAVWMLRPGSRRSLPPPQPRSPGEDELRALLVRARGALSASAPPLDAALATRDDCVVCLSLAHSERTAAVAFGRARDLGTAVTIAAARLLPSPGSSRLRLDVLTELSERREFDDDGRAVLVRGRDGLWLPGPDVWLLPDEITGGDLIDPSGDLRGRRVREYLERGGRVEGAAKLGRRGTAYRTARFATVVEDGDGGARSLRRGRAIERAIDGPALLAAAVAGGDYLLRHHHDDGAFDYVYRADRDEIPDGYNLLRHAGSCHALYELAVATGERRYIDAADRGLAWQLGHVRDQERVGEAPAFQAIVEADGEAKLGGAALTILAMLSGMAARGDREGLAQAQRLAQFIAYQQDPDGHLRSKYFYEGADEDDFESEYYPGEAILALVRLHRIDGDPRWLEVAKRAAAWLIGVRDRDKPDAELPHDHWLLMGLADLHAVAPDPSYLAHAHRIGGRIVAAIRSKADDPDWIGSVKDPPRATSTATRSEGLVALVRLSKATGHDAGPYLETLRRAVGFQLRCQFDDDSAMFCVRPDRALGGFRKGLDDGEIRIDYVQHNVSALLGLRSLL